MKYWSCDRWGSTEAEQTSTPKCDCSMCDRHRETIKQIKGKKKK
tara:strand:- start:581 stop:712 length:132 start_codon:yes stop_codon:yes gene_type:complete